MSGNPDLNFLAVWLAESGADVRYAGPAAGARDASEQRRILAEALRSMGLEGIWKVRADPPPPGRKGWSLWIEREKGNGSDAAAKFGYWASGNPEILTRTAGETVLRRHISRLRRIHWRSRR